MGHLTALEGWLLFRHTYAMKAQNWKIRGDCILSLTQDLSVTREVPTFPERVSRMQNYSGYLTMPHSCHMWENRLAHYSHINEDHAPVNSSDCAGCCASRSLGQCPRSGLWEELTSPTRAKTGSPAGPWTSPGPWCGHSWLPDTSSSVPVQPME